MPFPKKISCFVSTCISSDNSFLSVRQEPSFRPWKGSPFLQHPHYPSSCQFPADNCYSSFDIKSFSLKICDLTKISCYLSLANGLKTGEKVRVDPHDGPLLPWLGDVLQCLPLQGDHKLFTGRTGHLRALWGFRAIWGVKCSDLFTKIPCVRVPGSPTCSAEY